MHRHFLPGDTVATVPRDHLGKHVAARNQPLIRTLLRLMAVHPQQSPRLATAETSRLIESAPCAYRFCKLRLWSVLPSQPSDRLMKAFTETSIRSALIVPL